MQAETDSRQDLEPSQDERKAIRNTLAQHKWPSLIEAEEKLGHMIEASLENEHKDEQFLMGAVPTRRTVYEMDSVREYRAALDVRRRALTELISISR